MRWQGTDSGVPGAPGRGGVVPASGRICQCGDWEEEPEELKDVLVPWRVLEEALFCLSRRSADTDRHLGCELRSSGTCPTHRRDMLLARQRCRASLELRVERFARLPELLEDP